MSVEWRERLRSIIKIERICTLTCKDTNHDDRQRAKHKDGSAQSLDAKAMRQGSNDWERERAKSSYDGRDDVIAWSNLGRSSASGQGNKDVEKREHACEERCEWSLRTEE